MHSLQNKLSSLDEQLHERKEEKIAQLQDRVDSLEQYSRRNNVRISGIPESTGAAENADPVVKKVGEAIGVAVTDEMIDRSRCVGKPGKMGRDILVKLTSYRHKYLIMKASSNPKNKDAALLGITPAGATRQPVSATGAAATLVPSPAGRVYVNDELPVPANVPPLTTPIKLNSDSFERDDHTSKTSHYSDVPQHSALADNSKRTSCHHDHSGDVLSEDSTDTSHLPGHKRVHCIPPDLPLSEAEISVLSKALKFVPIKPSVKKFFFFFLRSLRWMAVLGHSPQSQINPVKTVFSLLWLNSHPQRTSRRLSRALCLPKEYNWQRISHLFVLIL